LYVRFIQNSYLAERSYLLIIQHEVSLGVKSLLAFKCLVKYMSIGKTLKSS